MAKQTERLTKRDLDALARKADSEPGFRAYVADAGQPGLVALVRRGRVRFVFTYQPPKGGSRRRFQIDDYGAITLDQAREIAQGYRGLVAAGVDPQEERERARREAMTVGEAVAGYLEDLRQRAESGARRGKRSGFASAQRRLERHVVPNLGSRLIRDVTSEDVGKLLRSMKSTPVEANRTVTALSAVFGWTDRTGKTPAGFNPTRHVERFAEIGRRRALTGEEVAALGAALEDADKEGTLHPSAILAVRLLALTGFRRSEVLGHTMKNRRGKREGLRWGDIDLDRGLVHLRDSKSGRQTRVLGAEAIAVLAKAKSKGASDGDCVCPGAVQGQPFIGIDKARKKLWRSAELDGVDLHSLRHTFASVGAHVEDGRYVGMVAPLLGHGHQSRAITERYITSNPEALRPAADAIAGRLAELLSGHIPAVLSQSSVGSKGR